MTKCELGLDIPMMHCIQYIKFELNMCTHCRDNERKPKTMDTTELGNMYNVPGHFMPGRKMDRQFLPVLLIHKHFLTIIVVYYMHVGHIFEPLMAEQIKTFQCIALMISQRVMHYFWVAP
jgi:hypothetical protein